MTSAPHPHLLLLSADSPAALVVQARQWAEHLRHHPDLRPQDVCFVAATGRSHRAVRLACIANSTADFAALLTTYAETSAAPGVFTGTVTGPAPTLAFALTGQGSQYAAMAHGLYTRWPVVRAAIDRCAAVARSALPRDLRDILFAAPDTPEAALIDTTQWTQPTLFAIEYGVCELLASFGIVPELLTGHSIGEIVAATRAGVFTLDDAMRLVVARGQVMADTPPGCMWSVRAAPESVAAMLTELRDQLAIAAINGPEQCVISGAVDAADQVVAKLRAAGYECRALRVSHAFHSPLMASALDPFRAAVAATRRSVPQAARLISNLDPHAEPSALTTVDHWVAHLREPVAFAAGLAALAAAGAQVVVEIGPHPALKSLQAANPGVAELPWIPTLRRERDDHTQLLATLGQLYTCGVAVDWPAVYADQDCRRIPLPTYPFQHQQFWNVDPRWLEASPQTTTPAAKLYTTAWPEHLVTTAAATPGTWLVVTDGGSHPLATLLAARDIPHVCLAPGDTLGDALTASPGPITAIVDVRLADLDPDAASLLDPTIRAVQDVHGLVQELVRCQLRAPPRVFVVTRGAQSLGDPPTPTSAAARAVWGLARVITTEHPEFRCTTIDLDPRVPGLPAALVASLQDPSREDQRAIRGEHTYVARLQPTEPSPQPPITGTWVIAGGFGALAGHVAQWLAEHGAKHVALLGRTCGPLPTFASATTVSGHAVDIADRTALTDVLAQVRRDAPPLCGVVHAAGVLDDALLADLTPAQLRRVLTAKVAGAWNLHTLTQTDELAHFVVFSSTAALLGNPGQANYAAANAYLDGLATARRALGLPAVSIQWGPWAGGGMATRTAEHLRRPGLAVADLDPSAGLTALAQVLGHPAPVVAAGVFQWDVVAAHVGAHVPPLVTDVLPQRSVPVVDLGQRLRDMPPDARAEHLQAWLGDQFTRLFGRPVTDAEQNLTELGIDSLLVVELLSALRREMGLMVYPREFYQHPSLAALARYLAHELDPTAISTADTTAPTTAPAWADAPSRARPTGPRNPPAAFVLSSPRSGSTLLRVMLAGHPALFSPPELHLLAFDTMQARHDALAGSYLDEGLQRAVMELEGCDAAGSQAIVDDWRTTDAPVQAVYAYLQGHAGAKLLVDKSPSYAATLDTLVQAEHMFDGALYVHLVRHPYAVIESFTRMRMDRMMLGGGHDPLHVAEESWLRSNANLLALRERIDPARYHLLRYEDLVHAPEREARALCQFLGVPFDPAVLEPYQGQRMTDGVHAQSLPIDDPNFHTRKAIETDLADVWRTIHLPRLLRPETQRVAAALGYVLPVEAAAATVAPREVQHTIRGLDQVLCVWGDEGPTVVLVHGILDHAPAWSDVAHALVAAGCRVLAPDLRGHGRSAHVGRDASYHLLDFVADLGAWLDAMTEGPVILAGHSFGASIAALVARTRPQQLQRLVLVEPGLPPAKSSTSPFADLRLQLDHLNARPEHTPLPDLDAAADRLRQQIPVLTPAQALATATRLTEVGPDGLRWRWDPRLRLRTLLHPSVQGIARADALTLLTDLAATLPVTAIFATNSEFNRPEDRTAQCHALAAATTHTIDGGHFLHLEAPTTIAELILGRAPQP